MATLSSFLAWRIPWTEEPDGLLSSSWRCTELDVTEATQHASMHWRRKWQPTPVFLPGEAQGQRRAAIYGVIQSRTRLKRLNSSSTQVLIAFLPINKCFRVSWLQSPSTVILEPREIKSVTVSIGFPSICYEVMGLDAVVLVF